MLSSGSEYSGWSPYGVLGLKNAKHNNEHLPSIRAKEALGEDSLDRRHEDAYIIVSTFW
jgi:hypothetical protein